MTQVYVNPNVEGLQLLLQDVTMIQDQDPPNVCVYMYVGDTTVRIHTCTLCIYIHIYK